MQCRSANVFAITDLDLKTKSSNPPTFFFPEKKIDAGQAPDTNTDTSVNNPGKQLNQRTAYTAVNVPQP